MARKPPIVIVTIVLSVLMLIPAAMGLYGAIGSWQLAETGDVSVVDFAIHLAHSTGTLVLAAATLYAGFRRPAWGHVITILFGTFILVLMAITAINPDPHPLLPLRNDAEEVGAGIGRALMVIAVAAYLGFLIFGRNARDYYGNRERRAGA